MRALVTGLIDLVWGAMTESEFYTPDDLANTSTQSSYEGLRILEFLTRHGFVERITRREPIYRKLENAPNPGDALRILQTLIEDTCTTAA